jgi:hypothetical protein
VWRRVRIRLPQPCKSQKATKWEPGAWRFNLATLSLGDINTEIWYSRLGVGRKADDLALQKKNTVAKSKEVKTRWFNSRQV